jgi:hypothetical protein
MDVVVTAGEDVLAMGRLGIAVVTVGGPGSLCSPGTSSSPEIRLAAG